MLVEGVKHFLLLLVVVAPVNLLSLVLGVQLCTRLHSVLSFFRVHLGLHVGDVGLVRMRGVLVSPDEVARQVLAHPHHP